VLPTAHARPSDRDPIEGTYHLLIGDGHGVDVPGAPFSVAWSPRSLPPQTGPLAEDPTAWEYASGLHCIYRRDVFDGDGDDRVLHVTCEADDGTLSLQHALIYFAEVGLGVYAGEMVYAGGAPGWDVTPNPCIVAVRGDLPPPTNLSRLCP
jgi:hypothetical protein